jgi:hypothetical protein
MFSTDFDLDLAFLVAGIASNVKPRCVAPRAERDVGAVTKVPRAPVRFAAPVGAVEPYGLRKFAGEKAGESCHSAKPFGYL